MAAASSDIWEVMSTARTIRRFTDEPVDDATLTRCLEAATWAPSGANAQAWRFVVLRSPEQRAVVAKAAAHALEVIEPVYGMTRPAEDDHSARARNNRATYELHDRAGEFTSVLFAQIIVPTFPRPPSCCSADRSSRRCRTFCSPPAHRVWCDDQLGVLRRRTRLRDNPVLKPISAMWRALTRLAVWLR